mgnify:CR=1 FL=1
MYCYSYASPTLTNCMISSNTGPGVYCYDSSPTLTNCTISGNTTSYGGAGGEGVRCSESSPTLTNCTISDNAGPGVYCYDSSPTLTNCTISGNTASDDGGGGLYCAFASPTLTNCTISGNTCSSAGGGVYCERYSGPTLTNCTISGNTASYYGGGVCCFESSPTLTNCTISGNTTSYEGGGLCCDYYSSPTLTNCILWADLPQEIYVSGSTLVITYCDVQGGWEGLGNIDADPLFVDPDGPDDDPATWEDNDYRLGPGSPCIDAGDNSAVPPDTFDLDGDGDVSEPVPFDLSVRPRFVDDVTVPDTGSGAPPLVDMGAYEYAPPRQRGDLNCDNLVNVFDIDPFVLALTSGPECEPYYDEYPDCDCMLADINCDGHVNVFDIDPFVECLVGDCPPCP